MSEWVMSVDSLSTSGNSTSEEKASLYCLSTGGNSISEWAVSVDSSLTKGNSTSGEVASLIFVCRPLGAE